MKKILKWRYYCEFCKKSGMSSFHMQNHETSCTANPDRVCGLCRIKGSSQKNLSALVPLLSFDNDKVTGMAELREATSCPACILAAIRMATKHLSKEVLWELDFGFDFEGERKAFWRKVHGCEASENPIECVRSLHGIILVQPPVSSFSYRYVTVGLGVTGVAMLQDLNATKTFPIQLRRFFSGETPIGVLEWIGARSQRGESIVFIVGGIEEILADPTALDFVKLARKNLYLAIAIIALPDNVDTQKQTDLIKGVQALRDCFDTIIVLPLDITKMDCSAVPVAASRSRAYVTTSMIISMLHEILVCPGYIGVEGHDLKRVIPLPGWSAFGCGEFKTCCEIPQAIDSALSDISLTKDDLATATGVIFHIAGSSEVISKKIIDEVSKVMLSYTRKDSTCISGICLDDSLGPVVKVSLLATGIPEVIQTQRILGITSVKPGS